MSASSFTMEPVKLNEEYEPTIDSMRSVKKCRKYGRHGNEKKRCPKQGLTSAKILTVKIS